MVRSLTTVIAIVPELLQLRSVVINTITQR